MKNATRYIFLFLLSLHVNVFAQSIIELKRNYSIEGSEVKLSDIVQTPKKNEILFNINKSKHIKRVERKILINLLKEYGYEATSKYRYIQFNQKSPIDTQTLKNEIIHYYQKYYTPLEILHVTITPRTYIDKLPQNYLLKFRSKNYLFNKGVVALHSHNKVLYFNYTIDAKLPVCVAKHTLKKGSKIDHFLAKLQTVFLERFKALPLQKLSPVEYQAKHKIKQGSIITLRDVEKIYLVKRGETVSVDIKNGAIVINFSAKAKQNGRLSDIITIQKNDGKKLKAVVTGKNKVEVQ